MKLLIVVIYNPERLGDILPVLVELDVRGGVAVDAESMTRLMSEEIPLFAGLRSLVTQPHSRHKVIIGLTDREKILEDLEGMLKEIGIDFSQPGTGYALLLPVEGHRGSDDE